MAQLETQGSGLNQTEEYFSKHEKGALAGIEVARWLRRDELGRIDIAQRLDQRRQVHLLILCALFLLLRVPAILLAEG